ncbi:MAG: type II toxin-antitoxin system RelE/ParE family toxin [Planctomycetota bacterium]
MARLLRIRPQVRDDLADLASQIAVDSVTTAERFIESTIDFFKDLPEWAMAYPVYEPQAERHPGLRSAHIPGFRRHLVFFVATDRFVEVIRVLHGARDLPGAIEDT